MSELTRTEFVMSPACASEGRCTTIVRLVASPAASAPGLQVTVCPFVTHPSGPLTNVTAAGRLSVTTTPTASLGPALLTTMLYVRLLPAHTRSGSPVLLTVRSARGMTSSVLVTPGAAFQLASPSCEAATSTVPGPVNDKSVPPEISPGPDTTSKLTGRPESAVATSGTVLVTY